MPMITQLPSLTRLTHCQSQVRNAICRRCPHRSDAPACEKSCPLFRTLPALLRAVGQLDPMVPDRASAIKNLVAQSSGCQREDSPLYRHRRRLAHVIYDCTAVA
jgi:hypothetical protein